jgi:hypothetical protein
VLGKDGKSLGSFSSPNNGEEFKQEDTEGSAYAVHILGEDSGKTTLPVQGNKQKLDPGSMAK